MLRAWRPPYGGVGPIEFNSKGLEKFSIFAVISTFLNFNPD
jgi:hypothetical protein